MKNFNNKFQEQNPEQVGTQKISKNNKQIVVYGIVIIIILVIGFVGIIFGFTVSDSRSETDLKSVGQNQEKSEEVRIVSNKGLIENDMKEVTSKQEIGMAVMGSNDYSLFCEYTRYSASDLVGGEVFIENGNVLIRENNPAIGIENMLYKNNKLYIWYEVNNIGNVGEERNYMTKNELVLTLTNEWDIYRSINCSKVQFIDKSLFEIPDTVEFYPFN